MAPDGQMTDAKLTSEGQYAPVGGPEGQGAALGPAQNAEGLVVCDRDADGAEGQDGDLQPTHQSSGPFPNTNPNPFLNRTTSNSPPSSARTPGGARRWSSPLR